MPDIILLEFEYDRYTFGLSTLNKYIFSNELQSLRKHYNVITRLIVTIFKINQCLEKIVKCIMIVSTFEQETIVLRGKSALPALCLKHFPRKIPDANAVLISKELCINEPMNRVL
jgi:hypothetical protein